MLFWLTQNVGNVSLLGGAIAFAWSIIRFVLDRQKELETREFDAYHRLVKELVSPDPESKVLFVDRQAAIVFELRHFPRYFEFSKRMLMHLKQKWSADPAFQWKYLIDEIDLTLSYIVQRL